MPNTHKQDHLPAKTYLPIEDHGIIGDLHTVALVGKNGTIDWCCVPAFDAPSIFGSLLDAEKGGFFRIPLTHLGWSANRCICQIPISSLRAS